MPARSILDVYCQYHKMSKHMKSRWFLLSMQSEAVRITSTSQHSMLKLSLACRSAENNPSADKVLVDISGLVESTAIPLQSQEPWWCVLGVLNFALNIPHSSVWSRLPCSSTLISAKAVQKWFTFLVISLCAVAQKREREFIFLECLRPMKLKQRFSFLRLLFLLSLLECDKRNCICANKECIATAVSQSKVFSRSSFFSPQWRSTWLFWCIRHSPEFLYVDYNNGFRIDQRSSKHAGNVLVHSLKAKSLLNRKLLRC